MDLNDFRIPKLSVRFWGIIGLIVAILILSPMTFGINDAGHRTVVQYPWGTLYVKFSPGIYTQWFGTVTEYQDLITFDYDKSASVASASLDQKGIVVRYQDGGTGTVFGQARFFLPSDEPTMVALHKAFRSNLGVSTKLIRPLTEEAMNLTAGLMTSEEAYTERRGTFKQWAEDQVSKGNFQTELQAIYVKEGVSGERALKNVPVIKYGKDGRPVQYPSDLVQYGITVRGFQITDWDFEKKTLDQIATKREATMGIITAKANAERAKQDAITAEEVGKKDVMTAQYKKEVEKKEAIVAAEKAKEVAIIAAQQNVAVAEQKKLEAEQLKLAAVAYKQEQVLRGEGDGAYKRLVMEADGALQQKIAAIIQINENYANSFGRQKWVPEFQMGSNGSGGNAALDLINLVLAKTAKDLNLDLTIPKGKTVK